MLLVTQVWARKQKWLIASSVALGLAVLGTAIYVYERYYRGPGAEVLYGTWEIPDFPSDNPVYFRFGSDGTFALGGAADGELHASQRGRWYAGGTTIYLRFEGEAEPRRPMILHIVDIQSDELRIRYSPHGDVYIYRRAHLRSPHASNKTLQPTAQTARFPFTLNLASILKSAATSPLLSRG